MSPSQLTSTRPAAEPLQPTPGLGLELSDASLVDATAAAIAIPRSRAADSFVLHAPLELLARAALLPMVEPDGRNAAREQLRALGDGFTAWGAAVEPPERPRSFDGAADALALLQSALAAGELEDADAAATWLAHHLEAWELRHVLADPVLPLLSAAGHGSIFLHLLPRVAPRSPDAARMVRSLVRELARYPGWDLSWFDHLSPTPTSPTSPTSAGRLARELAHRLAQPVSHGDPGSDFIYPVMSLTERSGLAHEHLHDIVATIPHADGTRVLLRTAAMSMLQDDPAHAPYGWSHCLTMSQAALGVADACAAPWRAVAVAATYVLGFRGTISRGPVDLAWAPPNLEAHDVLATLDSTPEAAAAAVWHSSPEQRSAITARLATRAATHHDAHLVKYTLACFDAARTDPDAQRLYLAAAAYLGAWWAEADVKR